MIYNKRMAKLEDYMTVSEFAGLAGVSVQAIHKAMKEKRIKDFQRVGSVYLIGSKELNPYKAKSGKKNHD